MAQGSPDTQVGVEAIRTLLEKDQQALVKLALSGSNLDDINNTIKAIGNSADNRGNDLLADVVNLKSMDIEVRRNAVRAIAKSRGGVRRLLRGVEAGKLDPALISAAAAELNRSLQRDIRERAAELFPLPATKSAEQLPSIRELSRTRGDSENGQKIFANAGTCAKCHIVGQEGKEVGPNLTEIGSKLSREAMFESMLYPSAGISHNYEAYNLVTTDGNAIVGLVTSQTDEQVVITSDDGIARTFKRGDIEMLKQQEVSLMPADLQKLMTKQELIDVVEYMSTLKKK